MKAHYHVSRSQILKLKMLVIAAKAIILLILVYGAKQYYFSDSFMPKRLQQAGLPVEKRVTIENSLIERTCGIERICVPYQLCNHTIDDQVEIIDDFYVDREDTKENCGYLNQCCNKSNVISPQSNEVKHMPLLYKNCSFASDYQRKRESTCPHKNHTNLEQVSLPWVVNVVQRSNYGKSKDLFICGGSLITPIVVLTAASCFHTAPKLFGELFVRAGEFADNLQPIWVQERRVREKIQHEQYRFILLENNVLLLIVERPFDLNLNVQPVCLPPSPSANDKQKLEYNYCFVAGFPRGEYDVAHIHRLPDYNLAVRRRVTLHLLKEEDHCTTKFLQEFVQDSDTKKLKRSLICIGKRNKVEETCHADAGSAIVCSLRGTLDFYQIGIFRKSVFCDGFDLPNMQTNVAYFRPWIEEKLKKLNILLE